MSIELLLLIIAFVLLPLIQQLLRAATERAAPGEPGQPPRPPARRTGAPGPALPSQVAMPPPRALPPAAPAMPPVPSMAVPPPAASRSTLDAAIPVSRDRRRVRHRGMMGRFSDPYTLRDAIVVMTILGPCRALVGDDEGAPLRG